MDKVHYCERFLELLIDLEALLPTRRFFNIVLDACHVVVRCSLSNLHCRPEGKLFRQVVVYCYLVLGSFKPAIAMVMAFPFRFQVIVKKYT